MGNSLPVIGILAVGNICEFWQLVIFVVYSLHISDIDPIRSFDTFFYYNFLEIPCVQTILNFLSREIKIHIRKQ
jgi:hypothetical protein